MVGATGSKAAMTTSLPPLEAVDALRHLPQCGSVTALVGHRLMGKSNVSEPFRVSLIFEEPKTLTDSGQKATQRAASRQTGNKRTIGLSA